jgi:O-antigen ligase
MSRTTLFVLALPLLVIAVVLIAEFAIASFRSPIGVLLPVFAAIVPIGSIAEVPLPLPAPFNTPSSVVGAVTLAALIVHLIGERAAGRSAVPRVSSTVAWWGLFGLVASASFFWSINPDETLDELLVLWSLICLYGLAVFAVATREDLRRLETGIVLGGAIAAGYAIALLASSGLAVFGGDTPRFAVAGGVHGEAGPNETAAALLVPLAVAAGRAVDPERQDRGRWVLASALIAGAIAMTGSRGGLLSMAVVLGLIAWDARRPRMMALVGLAAVAVLLIVPAFGAGAIQERLFKETSSGRSLIWATAFEACDRHCAFGSGYGTFPDVYNEALGVSPSMTGQRLRQRAHNVWIRAGVETGLAGLIFMTGAFWLQAADLVRLPRHFRGPPLAGFLGVLTANVFLSNIGFKYFWLAMMYATVAVIVGRGDRRRIDEWEDALPGAYPVRSEVAAAT